MHRFFGGTTPCTELVPPPPRRMFRLPVESSIVVDRSDPRGSWVFEATRFRSGLGVDDPSLGVLAETAPRLHRVVIFSHPLPPAYVPNTPCMAVCLGSSMAYTAREAFTALGVVCVGELFSWGSRCSRYTSTEPLIYKTSTAQSCRSSC